MKSSKFRIAAKREPQGRQSFRPKGSQGRQSLFSSENKVSLSFSVIYEEAPGEGYVASVPSLPGCHTQGQTIEEAEKNIQEAIELYVESLEAHGEKIPQEKRIFQGKIEIAYPLQ